MQNGSDDALLQLSTEFPAAADYLSTILLIHRDYGEVHNTMLSNRLGVSKPAVSQAVTRLKHIGLLNQDSYRTIELTEAGRDLAETIVRRHYLIEHLLIQSVDFPWEDADAEALRLQTVISGDLAEYLYNAFDRPTVCPHGNPFPGSSREADLLAADRLTSCEAGSHQTIVRITEEGEGVPGLLGLCHKHRIRPGTRVKIHEVRPQSALRVSIDEGKPFEIPWSFCSHLRVADS